jgi:anthranilate synthase component 1
VLYLYGSKVVGVVMREFHSSVPLRLSLDEESFVNVAREQQLLSVTVELSSDMETPVSTYAKLVGDQVGFLLESVEQGERWSRYSVLGRAPLAILTLQDGVVRCDGDLGGQLQDLGEHGIFAALRTLLLRFQVERDEQRHLLQSGLVGYLGYDTVREIESLPNPPQDVQGHPDACFQLTGEVVVFDHWRQVMTLVKNVISPVGAGDSELRELYRACEDALYRMAGTIEQPLKGQLTGLGSSVPQEIALNRWTSSEQYCEAVLVAKEHIVAGDVFQVVLSQGFGFHLDSSPFELYRVLRRLNPSPYMYYFQSPEVSVVGSSPEALVKLEGRKVISRPIAGTRRRGRDSAQDKVLAAQLLEHPKERAEHVMLVDLARNDLGRVGEFGSVSVDELMTLEQYSHVMHMTSQVSAVVREPLDAIDVLRATLPAGTLSGAPKVRAMEIIDELESSKRSIYGGVLGYLDFDGDLDVAITIRTAVIDRDGNGYVRAGAGIVADSDPRDEDLECVNKASALLVAVGLANELFRNAQAVGSGDDTR